MQALYGLVLGFGGRGRLRKGCLAARDICALTVPYTLALCVFWGFWHCACFLNFLAWLASTILSLGFWLLAAVVVLYRAPADSKDEIGFSPALE